MGGLEALKEVEFRKAEYQSLNSALAALSDCDSTLFVGK